MPTWVQSGGLEAWIKRLKDPAIRARLVKEMRTPSNDWENLLLLAGGPDNVLLVAFKNPKLKPLTGKTLAEVAKMRGKSPEETAIDLVIEDGSRVGTVYFLMSEDNVKREVGLPWMSFGSDEASEAPEGVFLKSSTPPARLRQFRARCSAIMSATRRPRTLPDAVRRLTSLPATNLGITQRGCAEARLFWRRRGVRPGDDPGPRDLREAQAARDRRRRRVRQRRPGAEGRQAHRRQARPRRARPRLDRLARRRRVQVHDLLPAFAGEGGPVTIKRQTIYLSHSCLRAVPPSLDELEASRPPARKLRVTADFVNIRGASPSPWNWPGPERSIGPRND